MSSNWWNSVTPCYGMKTKKILRNFWCNLLINGVGWITFGILRCFNEHPHLCPCTKKVYQQQKDVSVSAFYFTAILLYPYLTASTAWRMRRVSASSPRATLRCRTRWCSCWSGAVCVSFLWGIRCHWWVWWGTSDILWVGEVTGVVATTTDALELHMSRANYQAKAWLQADRCHMSLG